MKYNILSGASPDVNTRLYFDMFLSEKVYLGFARRDPVWGLASLIKVQHRQPWPFGVMASIADQGQPTADKKFFDLNSYRLYPETAQSLDAKAVYFGRVRKDNYVDPVAKTFTQARVEFFGEEEVGQVTLDYMSSEWARVQGLDPRWQPSDFDVYDYYIFNSNFDCDNASRIEMMKVVEAPALYTRCYIAYTTSSTSVLPTARITDAGVLERRIGLNGELVITGMKADYDLPDAIKNATFFIVDENGVILMDALAYVETLQDDAERALVFSYNTVAGNASKFKVTTGENYLNRLAIFNESHPVASLAAPVADNNPPSLQMGYVKHPTITKSIFDELGLVKITASDVKFVKEMMYTDQAAEMVALGFTIETMNVARDEDHDRGTVRLDVAAGVTNIPLFDDHTFVVGDAFTAGLVTCNIVKIDRRHGSSCIYLDRPTSVAFTAGTVLTSDNTRTSYDVEYAVTTDPDLAVEFLCDSVMIEKALSSTVPTDEIYRQLFICYRPKDDVGAECSLDTYSDTFDQAAYMWNFGMLLYISNKVPVYRRYIVGEETFKIVI